MPEETGVFVMEAVACKHHCNGCDPLVLAALPRDLSAHYLQHNSSSLPALVPSSIQLILPSIQAINRKLEV